MVDQVATTPESYYGQEYTGYTFLFSPPDNWFFYGSNVEFTWYTENGSAIGGVDYISNNNSLTTTVPTIYVEIIQDNYKELDETFYLYWEATGVIGDPPPGHLPLPGPPGSEYTVSGRVTVTISSSLYGELAPGYYMDPEGAGLVFGDDPYLMIDGKYVQAESDLHYIRKDEIVAYTGQNKNLISTNGADVFNFPEAIDIGKKGVKISAFQPSEDYIDLSEIDANGSKKGDKPFKFLKKDGADFTGKPGQVIWDRIDKKGTAKDVTLVQGDINGNEKADFTLKLEGLMKLDATDFFL